MKSGFKDPISPKVKPKQMKSPWDFTCPEYDDRSGCYANAGSHYGVGFKTPVGSLRSPSKIVATLPHSRVKTEQVDEIPIRNDHIEMID